MSELMKDQEAGTPQADAGAIQESPSEKKPTEPGPETVEKAKKKLETELKEAKDKDFADLVIGHLSKRCGEDPGFATDVLQEGKSWASCYEFIYKKARNIATGNRAVVRNDVVYEWAEDYYRMTPEQEKEARIPKPPAGSAKKEASKPAAKKPPKSQKAAEKSAKASQNEPKTSNKAEKASGKNKPEAGAKKKQKSNELDGQLSLFDFM